MNKILLLLLLFVFFPMAGCYSQKQDEILTNFSQTEDGTWDLGQVKEGKVVKKSFTFKNDAGKIIHIKDVTTSCGCTVSRIKEKTLLPGESTPVEVQFNSKSYSGPVTQFVYINTDNLDKLIIKYIIKADVVK